LRALLNLMTDRQGSEITRQMLEEVVIEMQDG
jgi:hypothetical protein